MSARSTSHQHHGGAGSAPRAWRQFITSALGVLALAAGGAAALFSGTASAATPTPVAVVAPAPTANVGLFGSADPTYDGVYRQSLAILGLVATGHTPNAPAVNWLLSQQCADGAFTAYRANTATACTAAEEDENSTALAIQALAALGKPTASAVAALRHFQLANGGFYDNTAYGPAVADANSTGLAESAFVAGGVDPSTVTSSAGKKADDYLRSVQIACSATSGAGSYDYQGETPLQADDYASVQALLGELGKAFPVAASALGGSVPTCPAAITNATTSAAAATSYLTARLAANNGAIPGAAAGVVDWTTTANAVLDLEAAGAGTANVAAALTGLEANAKGYVATAGVYAPARLATLLLVAHASGVDPGSFGGVDLTTTLATTERTAPIAAPAPTPSATPTTAPTTPTPTLPMTGAAGVEPTGSLAVVLVGAGLVALAVSRGRHRRLGQRRE
jgi:hypothetical protein